MHGGEMCPDFQAVYPLQLHQGSAGYALGSRVESLLTENGRRRFRSGNGQFARRGWGQTAPSAGRRVLLWSRICGTGQSSQPSSPHRHTVCLALSAAAAQEPRELRGEAQALAPWGKRWGNSAQQRGQCGPGASAGGAAQAHRTRRHCALGASAAGESRGRCVRGTRDLPGRSQGRAR